MAPVRTPSPEMVSFDGAAVHRPTRDLIEATSDRHHEDLKESVRDDG
jgi:hypothetical protein